MTKILFISPYDEDYLADSIFHGLRSLFDKDVIDFPRHEVMYKSNDLIARNMVYGNSFTLYGLLEDTFIERFRIKEKIANNHFDLIIFSNIFDNFGVFIELLPFLNIDNTAILDGADTPQSYPYAGKWWRYPPWWFLPKAHKRFLYFKREWTSETIYNMWFKLIPKKLCKYLADPKHFRPISFSIPAEKIVKNLPIKTKLFPQHIVDPEVAKHVKYSSINHVFRSEDDYYADLAASKFGITTKRSGWDCLRHYEIAANGTVPCFKYLNKKPETCAPHGLNKSNCIIYSNYSDLMNRIDRMNDQEYKTMQAAALDWVKGNTTVNRATQLLEVFGLATQRVKT